MNKETMIAMTKFYEENISTRLAEAFNTKVENISTTWGIDTTVVRADLSRSDSVAIFKITYTAENLNVEIESYKLLFGEANGQRYINGAQNQVASVDLQTLNIIYTIIADELSKEYTMPDSGDNCDNCEAVAAPDIAPDEE